MVHLLGSLSLPGPLVLDSMSHSPEVVDFVVLSPLMHSMHCLPDGQAIFGGIFFFHQGNSNYNSTLRDVAVIMLGSLPCPEGFSSGCPVFLPPQT